MPGQGPMDRRRRHLLLSFALAPATSVFRTVARVQAAAGAEPSPKGAGVLTVQASRSGGAAEPPLRYGEASPGPILRLQQGVSAHVLFRNGLDRPTSLDLHGIRVSPPLGGPGPLGGAIAPGADAEFAFTPPDAGTYWFHPWLLDRQDDATAQGLAGVILVQEATPPDIDADWVTVVSDRGPAPPRFALPGPAPAAPDSLWFDGRAAPRRDTLPPGSRVRLRIVNASTRQAVAVTLAGALPHVVAVDGQPSAVFQPLSATVPVGPGARIDLMFDMPRTLGEEVTLAVRGATQGAMPATSLVIKTEGDLRAARGRVGPLAPNPLLPRSIPLETSTRATLAVTVETGMKPGDADVWRVNGITGFDLPKQPLFRTRRGTPVTLTLRNSSPQLVAFRLHGFCMRLLHDLDDGWEPYWRDSVLVPPGVTHHAAFLADLPGRWLIESPFAMQAAGGLRAWFEVT